MASARHRHADRCERESHFWSAYAAVYDLIWDSPLTSEVGRVVSDCLPEPGTAVDLGCGTGLGSWPLVVRGWSVMGVDTSAAMLGRAVSSGRITTGVRADAARTGLASHCAEAVIVANLLHLHHRPDLVLDETQRLVRPGGTVVVVWPAESASSSGVLRADLWTSRPIGRSLIAAVLRILIGIPGAVLGARRWSSEAVTQAVENWAHRCSLRTVASGTIGRTQACAVFVGEPVHRDVADR
ncbi:MAG: methyltransferase domain-containing protein [Propionibacteriaceae bacterium]|jgi:SAM-dependent methyltransferase|nr:methyltransferase domain-containing protein [Propionibacteriaceae bacterium]